MALVLLSVYDLFAPPVSSMINRQCLGAMLTKNFADKNFALSGMTLNIYGDGNPVMLQEFPFYYFLTGILYKSTGILVFWGKLLSLLASIGTLILLYRLFQKHYDSTVAFWGGLFFVICPIGLLMRTSYQPDSLGMLFVLVSLWLLDRWRESRRKSALIWFSLSLLIAGLLKFPLLIPFVPVIAVGFFFQSGRYRGPRLYEVIIPVLLFALPLVGWYGFALHYSSLYGIIEADKATSMFLIGDLGRFLSLSYYVRPIAFITVYTLAVAGLGFVACGLFRARAREWLLLLGIPFYFVMIPTSAKQHYYLYAVLPAFALVFGLGADYLWHRIRWVAGFLLILMLPVSLMASAYLLRQDKVMMAAAAAVSDCSDKDQKVVAILTHDRIYRSYTNVTELHFLAGRKGWVLPYAADDKIAESLADYRNKGAEILVLTWYTPELEPWFIHWAPSSFARDSGVDVSVLRAKLSEHYPSVLIENNWLIFDLK
jgi:hypothetical protein